MILYSFFARRVARCLAGTLGEISLIEKEREKDKRGGARGGSRAEVVERAWVGVREKVTGGRAFIFGVVAQE